MCDYCDCRSRPLLAELGAEHVSIASMIRAVRDALRGEDGACLPERARLLHQALSRHSVLEERTLYPELQGAGISEEELVEEHARIDATIDAAAAGVANANELRAALSDLEDHTHREEFDLFPATHQLLGDRAWDRINVERERLRDQGPATVPSDEP